MALIARAGDDVLWAFATRGPGSRFSLSVTGALVCLSRAQRRGQSACLCHRRVVCLVRVKNLIVGGVEGVSGMRRLLEARFGGERVVWCAPRPGLIL